MNAQDTQKKTVSLIVDEELILDVKALAREAAAKDVNVKVTFSDVVRDWVQHGIDTGALHTFCKDKYWPKEATEE